MDYVNDDYYEKYIYDNFNKEEQISLGKRYLNGDIEAGNKLMFSNINLVRKKAHLSSFRLTPSMDYEDLVQQGIIGLYKALERYKPSKGFKYTTYALWWVTQEINRFLNNNSDIIRLPVYKKEKLIDYRQVLFVLGEEHGRTPTREEIADYMNEDVETIKELEFWNNDVKSLNIEVGSSHEDTNTQLQDMLENIKALTPEKETLLSLFKEELEDVLRILNPRTKRILKLRFGLLDGRSRTLEEIGDEIGVTRERIRQIEQEALNKLRNSTLLKRII